MMKPRFFPSLIVIAVLLVACSPATVTVIPAQPVEISSTSTLPVTTAPEGTLAPTPLPVVTSRGPHLEATDPKTVSMASGGLQFVEFFEFW